MSSLICLCVPKYAVTSRDAIFQAFPVHCCMLQAIKTGQCKGLGAGLRFVCFFSKIKCMIQSSPRNSIPGIYGLIQCTAIPGMKPLRCPCFVTTKGCQEKFPGKELPYFFDQTMHGIFFIGKPAEISDGWIRYT